MRHIDHQICTARHRQSRADVSKSITRGYALAPATIILGLALQSLIHQLVIINDMRLGINTIGNKVKVFTGNIDRGTVRQVSALRKDSFP